MVNRVGEFRFYLDYRINHKKNGVENENHITQVK